MNDAVEGKAGVEAEDPVPQGFERLPEGLGFSDALQPSYRRVQAERVSIGIVVQAHHSNTMGICHGGVLMMLSDMVAASGLNLARDELAGSPTINLTIDFISAARRGEWIQADAEVTNLKKRFGFCSGAIYGRRGMVARFSGTFYFPDHDGMWKDGASKASILEKMAP